jgi:hypothetical protein
MAGGNSSQDERIWQLKRMLIANDRAEREGAESGAVLESQIADGEPIGRDNGILDRADSRIAAGLSEEGPQAACVREARDNLLGFAEKAVGKLARGDGALAPDEVGALEAIILVDGTRPSFLLADGLPDLTDPTMGSWLATVVAHRDKTARIARAVGRIQPRNGSAARHIGTGSLVDADRGLVLTNYHVIRDARDNFGIAMTRTGNRLRIDGMLEIDFAGEAGALTKNRYRIISVELPVGFGPGFGVIDAAVARIEALPASGPLPVAVPVLSRFPAYADGAMTSFATIGFPGAPAIRDGVVDGVDWGMVTRTLFRNMFGVKRLAPGRFGSPLGSRPDDLHGTAFGHDATTFGGASGSLLAAWADTDAPCFGLHFYGRTREENNALAFAAAADALAGIGVPIV